MARAGLAAHIYTTVTPHTAKHSYCTNWLRTHGSDEASLALLSEQVGTSVGTVRRTYLHHTFDEKDRQRVRSIDLDLRAIERDLEKAIGKKLRQLAKAVLAIRAGRAILPGLEPERIQRIWPLLLLPAPIFQNDVIWEHIDRLYPAELRHPIIQPLTVTESADYEWLMAQVAAGVSMTRILERKTHELWARRDLRSWLNDASDRIGVGESQFLGQLFNETMEVLAEPLKRREAQQPAGSQ